MPDSRLGRLGASFAVVSLDDGTMDRILDDLTEAAGYPRNSSQLNLARWDLKAALRRHGTVGADPHRTPLRGRA